MVFRADIIELWREGEFHLPSNVFPVCAGRPELLRFRALPAVGLCDPDCSDSGIDEGEDEVAWRHLSHHFVERIPSAVRIALRRPEVATADRLPIGLALLDPNVIVATIATSMITGQGTGSRVWSPPPINPLLQRRLPKQQTLRPNSITLGNNYFLAAVSFSFSAARTGCSSHGSPSFPWQANVRADKCIVSINLPGRTVRLINSVKPIGDTHVQADSSRSTCRHLHRSRPG